MNPPTIGTGRRFLGCFLLLVLLVVPLTGCTREGLAMESSEEDNADGEKDKKKELVPVEIAELGYGPIEAVLRFSTNLEAESEVQVFSQAARRVTELLVEEGDQVEKGDLLLRLQDEEQLSNLARVESQVERSRREHERQKNLYERDLIPEQAINDATYELAQLELSYDDAKRELSYTEVRAPISGRVTRRLVNLGDHITVNQHLFDIVDFETIVARVYVPEKERERLAVAQPARLFSESLGGEMRRGEVLRIAPIVDPQSGTVKVTVSVPRREGLVPGMYVEVELVTATHEEALLLPKRAVVYDDNRSFIFRVDDEMKVERLEIQPLLADREFIEPVPGQLQLGEKVVVAGQAGLKDGAKVRLAGEKPEPEAEAESEAAETAP